MRLIRAALAFSAILLVAQPVTAQILDTDRTFRVFLHDGRSLPSEGEYAIVGDRLVFVLRHAA